jgi:hypothetical protein
MSTSVRRANGSLTTVRRSVKRRRWGCRRNRLEVLADFVEGDFLIDVAGNRQRRIVRRVVGLEETGEVFERRGIEIGHRSDDRMLVRKILEQQLADDLGRFAVRLVVHAQTTLLFDRFALVVHGVQCDGRCPHAIRFEEQNHVELVGGHLLEIERVILIGLAVVTASVVLDQACEFPVGDVFRAFEHEMLEQMREPGAPFPLVARPDVVRDRDGDDRRRAIG